VLYCYSLETGSLRHQREENGNNGGGSQAPPTADPGHTGASATATAVTRYKLAASSSQRTLDYPTGVDLSVERAFKRLFDFLGSLVLTVLMSPVIVPVLIGAVVNGQSPFFWQQRVGRDGRLFNCLKFQTMVPHAEVVLNELLARDPELRAEWDRNQKLKDDPRITSIGRFLRAYSLDELPQLWNVLKGEMSLVGPRPMMRDQMLLYGRNVVVYALVRPGITGLWQVSGRNLLDFRKRVAMDVVYVRNHSLLLDAWILLKTIKVVLTRHGAY
jgi:undecaprenyl-phosphate galactose phosphotransferase